MNFLFPTLQRCKLSISVAKLPSRHSTSDRNTSKAFKSRWGSIKSFLCPAFNTFFRIIDSSVEWECFLKARTFETASLETSKKSFPSRNISPVKLFEHKACLSELFKVYFIENLFIKKIEKIFVAVNVSRCCKLISSAISFPPPLHHWNFRSSFGRRVKYFSTCNLRCDLAFIEEEEK